MKKLWSKVFFLVVIVTLLFGSVPGVNAQSNTPESPSECTEVRYDPSVFEGPHPNFINYGLAVSVPDLIEVYQSAYYPPNGVPIDAIREMFSYLHFPAHVNYMQLFATLRSREDGMFFDLTLEKNSDVGGLVQVELLPDPNGYFSLFVYELTDNEIELLTTGFGSTRLTLNTYSYEQPAPSGQTLQSLTWGVYYCYTPSPEYFWKLFLPNMLRRIGV